MAPAEEGARDTLTSSPSTSNLTAVESHGNSATAATKPQDKSTAPAKDEAEIERENIEAEREFADYGGDAPDPVRPAAQGRLSGGTDFGRRMTTRRSALSRRSTNYIDQKGEPFPPVLVHDASFADIHHIRSRAYTQARARESGLPAQTNEEADQEIRKRDDDANKVVWAPGDPENPQNWSYGYKWWVTIIGSILTIDCTLASSVPSSGIRSIAERFNVSTEVSSFITSIFLAGYIAGPMIWAPLSEMIGRRPVFIVSMAGFVLFQLGDALGQNIGTILVTRFLAGVFAASPLTNAGGVIADIWDPVGRGPALSVYVGCVFMGPSFGPVFGGFVTVTIGWRWHFWLLLIAGGVSWVLMVICLPETYSPVLLARRAKKLRKEDPEKNKDLYAEYERADFSVKAIISRTLMRPFIMLFTEPIILLVTLYLSIVYGLLYSLFDAVPIIFSGKRGFTVGQSGLIFNAIGIGAIMGTAANILLQRHYRHLVPKWHGHPPAEERLPGACLAAPLIVIACFWLGWTGNYSAVPWYVPALALIPMGASFTLLFISMLSYLIDVYLMYSASALAANTIVRSAVGAGFPMFTVQMYDVMTIKWSTTLVGGIGILLAPTPFWFYFKGSHLRSGSPFAPSLDLHMAETVLAEEARELKERGEVERHEGILEKWKRKRLERHLEQAMIRHEEESMPRPTNATAYDMTWALKGKHGDGEKTAEAPAPASEKQAPADEASNAAQASSAPNGDAKGTQA